jgi:hypothetical protein
MPITSTLSPTFRGEMDLLVAHRATFVSSTTLSKLTARLVRSGLRLSLPLLDAVLSELELRDIGAGASLGARSPGCGLSLTSLLL